MDSDPEKLKIVEAVEQSNASTDIHDSTSPEDGKVIDGLTKVMHYSKENEPGVPQYAITVPRDESDEKSVFVIEEYILLSHSYQCLVPNSARYANKTTLDAHMKTNVIQDLLKTFGSELLLEGNPQVYNLQTLHVLTRPEANRADSYIVFGIISYVKGKVAEGLPFWKAVFETTKTDEPGSFGYCVCRDEEENPDELYTVEVYESEKYLWDVHAKSHAVKANMKTMHIREGLQRYFLKLVAGYFHK
ncbi:hypothetical protein NA57DRAFT_70446 [Rhizodiscina lignyota]|uniref:ABM domain-containing protein n=1 Tax=Rhizodiscina lignyota TaxID=1504668 RepID=A0A9P4MG69_9PEZI|nr:hypothetical protein NA57DRAFT_70446 [Rhizodiscina lignyota]